MPRCRETKADGTPCERIVPAYKRYCYSHDPDRAEERKRNASRAGKSVGGKEIKDLKRRISDVVDAVLSGSQDRGRAAVAIQGFNSLRGVLELERKVREVDELEARLEALELGVEGSPREGRGGRKWGA